MDFAEILSAANSLNVDDRIRLAEAIWDSLGPEPPAPELTDAQRQELERRLAEHRANPENVIPWEQIEADIKAKIRRRNTPAV